MTTLQRMTAGVLILFGGFLAGSGLRPLVRVDQPETVIQVETPDGLATITGPGAEWILEMALPIVVE